jgi:AraC-like DNA-binding protein
VAIYAKYCGSRRHYHAEHQHHPHGKLQLIANAADLHCSNVHLRHDLIDSLGAFFKKWYKAST